LITNKKLFISCENEKAFIVKKNTRCRY